MKIPDFESKRDPGFYMLKSMCDDYKRMSTPGGIKLKLNFNTGVCTTTAMSADDHIDYDYNGEDLDESSNPNSIAFDENAENSLSSVRIKRETPGANESSPEDTRQEGTSTPSGEETSQKSKPVIDATADVKADPDSKPDTALLNVNIATNKKSRKRKQIKTNFDDDVLPEAVKLAQQKEKERLERQKQRHVEDNDHINQMAALIPAGKLPEVVVLDDDFLNESELAVKNSQPGTSQENHEVIELSSDDEDAIIPLPDGRKTLYVPLGGVRHEVSYSTGRTIGLHGRGRWGAEQEQAAQIELGRQRELEKKRIRNRRNSGDLESKELTEGKLLVNAGRPDDEPAIFVAPHLTPTLQPHQLGGIRFMYDNVIESISEYKKSDGFGCILAHSMGLGKTIQVITFTEIFFRATNAHKVLVIVPINTIQNWLNEFNKWMPEYGSHQEERIRKFNVYILGDAVKGLDVRVKLIEDWHRDGGVLLIGYEMFRILLKSTSKKKPKKERMKLHQRITAEEHELEAEKEKEEILQGCSDSGRPFTVLHKAIREALLDPGPDMVICDEGHKIKNLNTNIATALNEIRTKRRIVLTGYPLQNNLMEYFCMVDFVRPMYLGTKKSFSQMFEKPIKNGQCVDSTYSDQKLAAQRTHILKESLKGFVQRRTHALLKKILPQCREYVVLLRKSPIQHVMYKNFVLYAQNEMVTGNNSTFNPLKAFAACSKIWNHPDVLHMWLQKKRELENKPDTSPENSNSCPPPTSLSKNQQKLLLDQFSQEQLPQQIPHQQMQQSFYGTGFPNQPSFYGVPQFGCPPQMFHQPGGMFPQFPGQCNSQYFGNPGMGMMPPAPQMFNGAQQLGFGQPPPGYYPTTQQQLMNMPPSTSSGPPTLSGPPMSFAPPPAYPGTVPTTSTGNFGAPPALPTMQEFDRIFSDMQRGGDFLAEAKAELNVSDPGSQSNNPQNPQQSCQPQYDVNRFQPNNSIQGPMNQGQMLQQCNAQMQQNQFFPSQQQQMFGFPGGQCPSVPSTSQEVPMQSTLPTTTNHQSQGNNNEQGLNGDKQETSSPRKGRQPKGETKKRETLASILQEELELDVGLKYDWAEIAMSNYAVGNLENGYKLAIAFGIINESTKRGEKILLFSQNLSTLTIIEEYLRRGRIHTADGNADDKWRKGVNYFRFDGQTNGVEREKLINRFNSDPNILLFLISTKAGSLGINLVSANRCILFDACWNPCHDAQAVCRVYRYGQQRRTYIYRLVMDNSMERAIFNRQISKNGLQQRVVDDMQVEANITQKELETLLLYDEALDVVMEDHDISKWDVDDDVLMTVAKEHHRKFASAPFLHESLMLEREDQLSEQEKMEAQLLFERERQAEEMFDLAPSQSFGPHTSVGATIRARGLGGLVFNRGSLGAYEPAPLRSTPLQRHLQLSGSMNSGAGGATMASLRSGNVMAPPQTFDMRSAFELQHGLQSIPGVRCLSTPEVHPQGITQRFKSQYDIVLRLESVKREEEVIEAHTELTIVVVPRGTYVRHPSGKVYNCEGTPFNLGAGLAVSSGPRSLRLPPNSGRAVPSTATQSDDVIQLD